MGIIPFVGLKLGEHHFEYEIDNKFFQHFEYDEFNEVDVKIDLNFQKKTTLLELLFSASGSVKVGEEYNDDNEDILIVPHGEYEINVAQYIYELIILAVPAKRVHPGVEDGTLKSEILSKLEELSPKEVNEDKASEEIDPRWNNLKKLL